MKHFRDALQRLDAGGKRRLAKYAKTSVNHLFNIAGGHNRASADLAARIEQAAVRMHKELRISSEDLLAYNRARLCATCMNCSLARAVRERA